MLSATTAITRTMWITSTIIPVKHGWSEHPRDWPYSTYRRYLQDTMYPPQWGLTPPDFNGQFGE